MVFLHNDNNLTFSISKYYGTMDSEQATLYFFLLYVVCTACPYHFTVRTILSQCKKGSNVSLS